MAQRRSRRDAAPERTGGSGRRTQADRTARAKDALRSAALDLILERGLDKLTLTELGERAGYSRGIVHYHFGSREALLADLVTSIIEAVPEGLGGYGVGLSAVQAVFANEAKRQGAGLRTEIVARIQLLNEAAGSHSAELNELAAAYNAAIRDGFERILQPDAERLLALTSMTPREAAAVFASVVRGLRQQWVVERSTFDITGAMTAFSRFLAMLAEVEPRSR